MDKDKETFKNWLYVLTMMGIFFSSGIGFIFWTFAFFSENIIFGFYCLIISVFLLLSSFFGLCFLLMISKEYERQENKIKVF